MYMKLSKQLTTVTPISKFVALCMVVALPFIGFRLGFMYHQLLNPGSEVRSTDQGATNDSGFYGSASTGPTCVGAVRPGQKCSNPYSKTIVVRNDTDLKEVAKFTPDANGNFRVSIKPGTYQLVTISDANRQKARSTQVVVTDHNFTLVQFNLDTGMR